MARQIGKNSRREKEIEKRNTNYENNNILIWFRIRKTKMLEGHIWSNRAQAVR